MASKKKKERVHSSIFGRIDVDPEKIKAMEDWPSPENHKQLQLGVLGF